MTRWTLGTISALILVIGITLSYASPPQNGPDNTQANSKSKLSKEELRRQKALFHEFVDPYWGWLYEEVPYIITDQERVYFKKLSTNDERESFIEQFWEHRNPHPGSSENAYKEEYYRRIAYANEHFGSGIPGWKTDRGRIYIVCGPPGEIDSHPDVESYERPESEGGGRTTLGPFEQWRYRFIDGVGNNIVLKFVDNNMDGEYHLSVDPGLKDALLRVRPYGMTFNEPIMGNPSLESMTGCTRLDLYTKICQHPAGNFHDLRAMVTSQTSAHLLPFDLRTDFIRATDETVLIPITTQIANSDVLFQNKDGVMHGVVDVYVRITGLAGRIVNSFGKSLILDVREHEFQQYQNHKTVYQVATLLRPGRYKLSLVLRDNLNGQMGSRELDIVVPSFSGDKLTYSSLILAKQIYPSPTSQVGYGPFWIGGMNVRPSVDNIFTRDQRLGIYMQVYGLGIDEKTHKPSLDVHYEVEKDGKPLLDQSEEEAKLKKASQQFTVARRLMDLQELKPGKYTVQVKVTDNIKNQTVSPSASFELR